MEAIYKGMPGIHSVVAGYAGGSTHHPSYEAVCSGYTGHAEVVQITYHPERISYRQIIDLFWKAHNPTTLNRQGADRGTQYRSIILYDSETQKTEAEASLSAAALDFKDPILTEIKPLGIFCPAEEYHQDFYEKNPTHPYTAAVIQPKLDTLKNLHLI